MARHNTFLSGDRAFTQNNAMTGTAPQYGAPQSFDQQRSQQFGQQGAQHSDIEAMYNRPSATGHDTGRMTMRDALNAITVTLGLTIVIGAAVALAPTVLGLVGGQMGAQAGSLLLMAALVIGLIGGLITGLVNAFKRRPSAALVIAYGAFEGLLLGGLTGIYEGQYSGIAIQAVTATLIVAGSVLVLFRLGILRTSPVLTKIFFVAMLAYLLFGLVNIGFMVFAGDNLRMAGGGLLGIAIGALAILMGAYSLVMDFEDVQRGVRNGVPRVYAWRCAFAITATLVWMYIEILRILSILRNN